MIKLAERTLGAVLALAVVAAPSESSEGEGAGAPPWPVEDRLFAHDQVDNWGFGNAVALDGDRAIVGAWRADIGGEADRGAAYVFVRQGAEWVEEAQLLAFDGAPVRLFGGAVG